MLATHDTESLLRLPSDLTSHLACPLCTSILRLGERDLSCTGPACRESFPIIDGIPVLINEANSVFRVDDFIQQNDTFFHSPSTRLRGRLRAIAPRLIPDITLHLKARSNYARLAELLLA